MPPPGGSGSSSGGVDVVTTTNPMFNDEAQLRPDEAQLRPDEVDETTDLHSPLAEHEQRGSPLGELWLMLTAPGNAVAGVASALHVNIYLLALGLILSTQYLPVMACVQMAAVGTIVLQVCASVFSPYNSFAIANCDTVPGAVLVTVIGAVVDYIEEAHDLQQQAIALDHKQMHGNATSPYVEVACVDDSECFVAAKTTIFVAIVFSNVLVASLLFLMGSGHTAQVVGFVPTTVQAAFLAGVGWKILKTGVTFMVTKADIKGMMTLQFTDDTPGLLTNLVLVMVLGLGINVVEVKFHHSKLSKWLWPIMLVVLTISFFIGLLAYAGLKEISFADAFLHAQEPARNESSFPTLPRDMGWLLGNDHELVSWFPQYDGLDFTLVYWGAIFSVKQGVNFSLLVIMTIMSILLNSVAIEEEAHCDVDLDRDLKTVALGNAVAAPFGGFIGYASAHKSLLCEGMGGKHHAGLWAALYFFGFWAMGHVMARWIPIPVIGGFIAAIGMELLVEWIWHMRHKLSKSEMHELLLLFLLMTYSFIGGFALGMLLSTLAFTARMVQTPVIKTILDGTQYQGKALRDWRARTILARHGSKILTFRLQGFIFFFTAEKLRNSLVDVLERKRRKLRPVEWLVLDFHLVDSIDATAITKIDRVLRVCKAEGILMVITGLDSAMDHTFHHSELTHHYPKNVKFMEDVDVGVEWACDQLLADPRRQFNFIKPDPRLGRFTLKSIIQGVLTYRRVGFGKFVSGEAFDSVTFREGGTRRSFKKGEVIAKQRNNLHGDEKLYFISQGSCIKVHQSKDRRQAPKRLEKRYAGTVIGEMSFFLQQPRHDSIIADDDGETVVFEYSRAQYEALCREQPRLGEELLKHVLLKLGDTIKRLVQEIHVLHVFAGEEHDTEIEEGQLGADTQMQLEQSVSHSKLSKFSSQHKEKESDVKVSPPSESHDDEEVADVKKRQTIGFALTENDDVTSLE